MLGLQITDGAYWLAHWGKPRIEGINPPPTGPQGVICSNEFGPVYEPPTAENNQLNWVMKQLVSGEVATNCTVGNKNQAVLTETKIGIAAGAPSQGFVVAQSNYRAHHALHPDTDSADPASGFGRVSTTGYVNRSYKVQEGEAEPNDWIVVESELHLIADGTAQGVTPQLFQDWDLRDTEFEARCGDGWLRATWKNSHEGSEKPGWLLESSVRVNPVGGTIDLSPGWVESFDFDCKLSHKQLVRPDDAWIIEASNNLPRDGNGARDYDLEGNETQWKANGMDSRSATHSSSPPKFAEDLQMMSAQSRIVDVEIYSP